ncbi:MAG: GNAT family N-acetyltransferase [Endozoicomonas sp.]
MTTNPLITPLTADEAQVMFDWVQQEGWNPGVHDAATFHKSCPGALVGLKRGNELIAVAAAFNHNHAFSYFGLYIVKPEYRGQGYGIQLTRYRLNKAGYRNIALDGVMEQYQRYRRIGFRLAHRTLRYQFQNAPAADTPFPESLQPLKDMRLIELLEYEQRLFPGKRKGYLKAWVTQPEALAWCIWKDKKIRGYALMRPCMEGFKIGPWFADSNDYASQLLTTLLDQAKGQPVYCDIPEPNQEALKLAEQLQGKPSGYETMRMYRGYQPDLDLERVFGVTSLEAG